MGNRRGKVLLAVLLILAGGIALFSGTAYGRYQAELVADLLFQAKPLDQISIAQQTWTPQEDGCILTFTLEKDAGPCRVFLAVSEGVTSPEVLEVILTVPGDTPVVVEGLREPIAENSAMDALFGPGFVFRFPGEEEGEELQVELSAGVQYTLTVRGLPSAAEQTSLLRLFIERAQA